MSLSRQKLVTRDLAFPVNTRQGTKTCMLPSIEKLIIHALVKLVLLTLIKGTFEQMYRRDLILSNMDVIKAPQLFI